MKRIGARAPVTRACPACEDHPERRERCPACDGLGRVKDEAGDAKDAEETPEGDLVRAFLLIEAHGVDGWLRLTGATALGEEPHPMLADALMEFQAELNRLIREDGEDGD